MRHAGKGGISSTTLNRHSGHGITLCDDGVGQGQPAAAVGEKGLSAPQFRESSFTMSVNNANGLARSGRDRRTDRDRDRPRSLAPATDERGRE